MPEMPEHAVHPWFESTTNTTLTSHNGWCVKHKTEEGSLEAFLEAHKNGYRWMQIDAVPVKEGLVSGHMRVLELIRRRMLTLEEVRRKNRHVVSLHDVLFHEKLQDVYWNIEVKVPKRLKHLLELLSEFKRKNGGDLSRVMISSPYRA
jgi:hypothetical protein